MMNPIKHISNLLYLRKVNKDITIIKEDLRLALTLVSWSKHFYKKKGSNIRNLLASILWQVRAKNPYQVQGDNHNKAMYDAYFEMENHIPSYDVLKAGDFLVRISNDYYYKKGYKYHKAWSWGKLDVTLKLHKNNHLYGFNGLCEKWIEEDELLMYRYATKEEIATFKLRQKQYKEKEKQIKFLQKQIEKLRKEQSKI